MEEGQGDKYICQNSGFFDYLDPYDKVMADRGFTIHDFTVPKKYARSFS